MSNTKKTKQKLISVIGPTAAGKTEIAVKLAKKFGGYIISADSRQMYEEFDIGTAKPENFPHYFADFLEPQKTYSAGQFKKDAISLIKKKKGLPMLVGGAPLYVSAITQNLELPEVEPDYNLRQKLEKLSLVSLKEKLLKLDKKSLEFIDVRNKRRLIRALEVALKTEKKFSSLRKKGEPVFNQLILFLNPSADELKKKIALRTKKMIGDGLVDETEKLLKKYPKECPAFSSIGYREVVKYLDGEIKKEGLEPLINRNTLSYAKRQIAWFKKEKGIEIKSCEEAENLVQKFLAE